MGGYRHIQVDIAGDFFDKSLTAPKEVQRCLMLYVVGCPHCYFILNKPWKPTFHKGY